MRNKRLIGTATAVAAVASLGIPAATMSVAHADTNTKVVAPQQVTLTPAQIAANKREQAYRAARVQAYYAAVAKAKRARHVRLFRALQHQAWVKRTRALMVRYALSKRGRGQYVAGAASEWAFDCSGFTQLIVRRSTGIVLPHYSGAQLNFNRGFRVSKAQLLPGDIMAWGSNGSQHASMYIGNGLMIGANNPRSDVVVESINSPYWAPRYAGARRLVY